MDNRKRWKEITVDASFVDAPTVWMQAQAKQYGFAYLLAHADDGVIWGKFDASGLKLSGDAFPEEVGVKLRVATLQQARLFCKTAELLVWKGEQGWKARLIADETDKPPDCLDDEQYLLWGTLGDKKGKKGDEFTLLFEGEQGLQHAPPITGLGKDDRVALVVRHYVEYDDETGQARIGLSRVVDLERIPQGGER